MEECTYNIKQMLALDLRLPVQKLSSRGRKLRKKLLTKHGSQNSSDDQRQPEASVNLYKSHNLSSFQAMETGGSVNDMSDAETIPFNQASTNTTENGYADPGLEWPSDGESVESSNERRHSALPQKVSDPPQNLSQDHVNKNCKSTRLEMSELKHIQSIVKDQLIDVLFGSDYLAEGNKDGTDLDTMKYSPRSRRRRRSVGVPPLSSIPSSANKTQPKTVNESPVKSSSNIPVPQFSKRKPSSPDLRKHRLEQTQGYGIVPMETPFISFTTSAILLGAKNENRALGMTISKLALGVYVQSVDPTSEAAIAGVLPGSILLRINGITVVGDPSHAILERLYTYQGWFGSQPRHPIGFEFVYASKVYRVLLLMSESHDWGIGWAPCGNFPLVQNVVASGLAATYGVQKGSILSCVEVFNEEMKDKFLGGQDETEKSDRISDLITVDSIENVLTTRTSFRLVDHVGMAALLKKTMQHERSADEHRSEYNSSQEENFLDVVLEPRMKLTFCFPPKGSRTFDWTKHEAMADAKKAKNDAPRYEYYSVLTREEYEEQRNGNTESLTPDCSSQCSRMFFGQSPSMGRSKVQSRSMHEMISSSLHPSYLAFLVMTGRIEPPRTRSDLQNSILAENYSKSPHKFSKISQQRVFVPCPQMPWNVKCSPVFRYWNVIADLHHLVSYHALGHNEDAIAVEYELFNRQLRSMLFSKPPLISTLQGRSIQLPASYTQQKMYLREISFYLCNSECGHPASEKQIVVDGAQVCDNILLQLLDVVVRYGSMGEGTKLNPAHCRGSNLEEDNRVALEQVFWAKEVVQTLSDALIFQATRHATLATRLYFLLKSYIGILMGKDVSKSDSKKSLSDNYSYQNLPDISAVAGARAAGVLIEMSHRLEISVAKASWDSQSPEKEQTLPYIFTRQSERSHGSRKRSTNTHIENFDSQPNNGLNSNSIALFDTMHSSSSNSSKHEETSLVFPMLRTTSWLLKSLSMKKSRKKINGGITQRIQNSSGPKFNKSDLAYLSANSSSITDGCQGIQVKSSDSSPTTTKSFATEPNISSCNCSDPRIGLYLVNGKETLDRINVFLDNLDDLCDEAEKYLVKTIPQRLTDYVFSTGSKNKASDLKEATDILRKGLELINNLGKEDLNSQSGSLVFPFVDVIHSKKHSTSLITGLDWDSTYILPSAHFPLLIGVTVNQYASSYKPSKLASTSKFESQTTDRFVRIKVKFERLTRDHAVTSLQSFVQNDYFLKSPGKSHKDIEAAKDSRLEYQYVFRGALGGEVRQTKLSNNNHHGKLQYCSQDGASPGFSFETSGSTSRTLKLHLYEFTVIHEESQKKRYASHTIDDTGKSSYSRFVGECFLDLRGVLDYQAANIEQDSHSRTFIYHTRIFSHNNMRFDCEGNLEGGSPSKTPSFFELETAITIAPLPNKQVANAVTRPITRHLLYKHGDDLRQEMLALQFMREVDCILKASGLDMKMRTFGCCPVASNRGFIEWMPSCVPLSKICDMSLYKSANDIVVELQEDENVNAFESVNLKSDYFMEMAASFGSSTGLTGSSIPSTKEKEQEPEEAESKGWLKHQFMTRPFSGPSSRDLASHINPIQDFLRSAAHDDSCPFYIDKTVMDNYVKSCAGWCVATYLLGVGDRHLDNILLNADTGQLIHCDFSFILGCDPKTYIPIRLSAEMVTGMGGRESTNYAKFLSLLGAAFNILRRPSNFRALCSLLRLATFSSMPDLCSNQTPEAAMSALIGRFRLDLSDDEAITYLEELVESCLENKLWLAVDAMHSIGKHF